MIYCAKNCSINSRVVSKPASKYRNAALVMRILCFSAIVVKATNKLQIAQKSLLPSLYPVVNAAALPHARTHMYCKSAQNVN